MFLELKWRATTAVVYFGFVSYTARSLIQQFLCWPLIALAHCVSDGCFAVELFFCYKVPHNSNKYTAVSAYNAAIMRKGVNGYEPSSFCGNRPPCPDLNGKVGYCKEARHVSILVARPVPSLKNMWSTKAFSWYLYGRLDLKWRNLPKLQYQQHASSLRRSSRKTHPFFEKFFRKIAFGYDFKNENQDLVDSPKYYRTGSQKKLVASC